MGSHRSPLTSWHGQSSWRKAKRACSSLRAKGGAVPAERLTSYQEGDAIRPRSPLVASVRSAARVATASEPSVQGRHPTHVLWLSVNGRPGWLLEPTGRELSGGPTSEREGDNPSPWAEEATVWIPSAEHLLDDAILLMAVHVLRDDSVLARVRERFPSLTEIRSPFEDEPIELEKLREGDLAELRERCREIDVDAKLVVTVLEGSSLETHFPIFGYGMAPVMNDSSRSLKGCPVSGTRWAPPGITARCAPVSAAITSHTAS